MIAWKTREVGLTPTAGASCGGMACCAMRTVQSGEARFSIVVPKKKWAEFFKLAHSSLTGGHFSQNRTRCVINRHFTWPTLGTDVQEWCCPSVRRQGSGQGRAPLQPLSVFTEPFKQWPLI